MQKSGRRLEKKQKSHFTGLDIAISRAVNCSQHPYMVLLVTLVGYFDVLAHLHRFPGQWYAKMWKEIEKNANFPFFLTISRVVCGN